MDKSVRKLDLARNLCACAPVFDTWFCKGAHMRKGRYESDIVTNQILSRVATLFFLSQTIGCLPRATLLRNTAGLVTTFNLPSVCLQWLKLDLGELHMHHMKTLHCLESRCGFAMHKTQTMSEYAAFFSSVPTNLPHHQVSIAAEVMYQFGLQAQSCHANVQEPSDHGCEGCSLHLKSVTQAAGTDVTHTTTSISGQ